MLFKANSIAARTGINGVEEIIIQTKTIGNAAIPTDENGRVWIYYGESDSIKGSESRYYVSAADIIKGRLLVKVDCKVNLVYWGRQQPV